MRRRIVHEGMRNDSGMFLHGSCMEVRERWVIVMHCRCRIRHNERGENAIDMSSFASMLYRSGELGGTPATDYACLLEAHLSPGFSSVACRELS